MRALIFSILVGLVIVIGFARAETTFTSADGSKTIAVDAEGNVVSPQGKTVMTFAADGSIYRGDGEYVGKLVGDTFYDKDGNPLVTIEADGTIVVRRELGRIVGTDVYDAKGELIGSLSDTSDTAKQLALMALRRASRKGPKVKRTGFGGPPPAGEAAPWRPAPPPIDNN